jgi:putative glutamine amidotransferase
VRRPLIGITSANLAGENGVTTIVNRPYVDAVLAAGGLPVVVPVLDPDDADDVLATIDGLCLTGGSDVDPARYGAVAVPECYGIDPARDAWEVALLERVALPVLAICRGMQVLNVTAGGSLIQHLPAVTDLVHSDRPRKAELVHDVEVVAGSRVHAVLGTTSLGVNTLHHQAVDAVGDGFVVTGRAPDGVVEAIEPTDDRPILAVQWHPELLPEHATHAALFRWLVDAAAVHSPAALGSRL